MYNMVASRRFRFEVNIKYCSHVVQFCLIDKESGLCLPMVKLFLELWGESGWETVLYS